MKCANQKTLFTFSWHLSPNRDSANVMHDTKLEPVKFQIIKPKLSTEEFLNLLTDSFPETKEEVLDPDCKGLIHLQIGGLTNYTNSCVTRKRFDELRRIFDFFEATVNKVDSTVENALYVSFLEHVNFEGLDEKEIKKYSKPDLFNTWRQLRK